MTVLASYALVVGSLSNDAITSAIDLMVDAR